MVAGAPGEGLGIVVPPVRATGLLPPFSRRGLPSMFTRAPLMAMLPEAFTFAEPLAAMPTETPLPCMLLADSMASCH